MGALALAVVIAAAVAVTRLVDRGAGEPEPPARKKELSRVLAEGVRYRDYRHPGVDRLAFKSCRMEKRKGGGFTFGAFNVLVVDELTLTVDADARGAEGLSSSTNVPAASNWLTAGLAEALLHAQGPGAMRFSGLRVNGLVVNRLVSNRVERVFTAEQAESGLWQGSLRLSGCLTCEPGGQERSVENARLVAEPSPALVYGAAGAERRIGL